MGGGAGMTYFLGAYRCLFFTNHGNISHRLVDIQNDGAGEFFHRELLGTGGHKVTVSTP
jgi:hypothetical protein